MGNLKRDYNRFIYKHRNKGIPNLMTWICVANAVVFVLHYLFKVNVVAYLFCSPWLIMRGEVWRLFSYIFTFSCEHSFFGSGFLGGILSIAFYYWIGKLLENVWGTLRFNFFYLTGILLQNLYVMLIYWIFGYSGGFTAHYLNMAMFISVATLIPDQWIRLLAIIPAKMKWAAWLDLGVTAYYIGKNLSDIFSVITANTSHALIAGACLAALSPLVALLNYVLHFGADVVSIFPDWMKPKRQKHGRNANYSNTRPAPNPDWAKNYRSSSGEKPYRHKCTVCGRTDTSCPDLEFRYCSKCKGYFCYCIDHINNHTHVQ